MSFRKRVELKRIYTRIKRRYIQGRLIRSSSTGFYSLYNPFTSTQNLSYNVFSSSLAIILIWYNEKLTALEQSIGLGFFWIHISTKLYIAISRNMIQYSTLYFEIFRTIFYYYFNHNQVFGHNVTYCFFCRLLGIGNRVKFKLIIFYFRIIWYNFFSVRGSAHPSGNTLANSHR